MLFRSIDRLIGVYGWASVALCPPENMFDIMVAKKPAAGPSAMALRAMKPTLKAKASALALRALKIWPKIKSEAKAKGKAKAKAQSGVGGGLQKKIGAPEGSKAWHSLQAIANGSKSRADRQGSMNYLKQLASNGNTAPLQTYQSKSGNIAKLNFLKSLSLDPEGAFCQVTEKETGSTEVERKTIDGWVHLWELAAFENIPFTADNMPLIEAVAAGYDKEPSYNKTLRDQGHHVYHYVKTDPTAKKDTHTKGFEAEAVKNVEAADLTLAKKALQQQATSSGLEIGDTSSGQGSMSQGTKGKKEKSGGQVPAIKTARQLWLKEALALKSDCNKAIENSKMQLIPITTKADAGIYIDFLFNNL